MLGWVLNREFGMKLVQKRPRCGGTGVQGVIIYIIYIYSIYSTYILASYRRGCVPPCCGRYWILY